MSNPDIKYKNQKKQEEIGMSWITSPALVEEAKEKAAICLENGEDTKALYFGALKDTIFVSSDPEKLHATETFKLGGVDFFIGTKKIQ